MPDRNYWWNILKIETEPIEIAGGFTGVEQVETDSGQSCMIDSSHRAWCWGDTNKALLGFSPYPGAEYDPEEVHRYVEPHLTNFPPLKDLVGLLGYHTSCGIERQGHEMYCVGIGEAGKNPAYDSLKQIYTLADARGFDIDQERSVACSEDNFSCECTLKRMEESTDPCTRSVRTHYFEVTIIDRFGFSAKVIAYAPL